MPHLAPCARCGHPTPRLADSVHWAADTDSLVWLGICDECKALGPIAPTPERAVELWNQKQACTLCCWSEHWRRVVDRRGTGFATWRSG